MKNFKIINHKATVFDLIKAGACKDGIEKFMTLCKNTNTNFSVTDPIPLTKLHEYDLEKISDCLEFLQRVKIIEKNKLFPYGTVIRGRCTKYNLNVDYQNFLIIKTWEISGKICAHAVMIDPPNRTLGFTYGHAEEINASEDGITLETLNKIINSYEYVETIGMINNYTLR